MKNSRTYGLENGYVIAINKDETPIIAKELNIVQEILSNVGRFNSLPGAQSNNGNVVGGIPGGL